MFENIRRYIPKNSKIKILENIVDPEIQIEYFDFANQIREQKEVAKAIENKEKLLQAETSIEEKRKLLVLLAVAKDVEAYRTIEQYAQNPDEELKDWAVIAKNESEITIQNYLLDEEYTIIGSGLGGKDNKLRFVVILITRNRKQLTDFQKDRLKKEIEITSFNFDCEIEKLTFGEYFVSVIGLFPLDETIERFFDTIVENVNEFGNFMDDFYIVSNIKEYSKKEIVKLIEDIEQKSKQRNIDYGDFGDVIDDQEDDYFIEEDDDEEDDDYDDDF